MTSSSWASGTWRRTRWTGPGSLVYLDSSQLGISESFIASARRNGVRHFLAPLINNEAGNSSTLMIRYFFGGLSQAARRWTRCSRRAAAFIRSSRARQAGPSGCITPIRSGCICCDRRKPARPLQGKAFIHPAGDAAGHDLHRIAQARERGTGRAVAVRPRAVRHEQRAGFVLLPHARGDDLAPRQAERAGHMALRIVLRAAHVQQHEAGIGLLAQRLVRVPAIRLEPERGLEMPDGLIGGAAGIWVTALIGMLGFLVRDECASARRPIVVGRA